MRFSLVLLQALANLVQQQEVMLQQLQQLNMASPTQQQQQQQQLPAAAFACPGPGPTQATSTCIIINGSNGSSSGDAQTPQCGCLQDRCKLQVSFLAAARSAGAAAEQMRH
jgi:hypothetical protein